MKLNNQILTYHLISFNDYQDTEHFPTLENSHVSLAGLHSHPPPIPISKSNH